jgi:hypothetical protein
MLLAHLRAIHHLRFFNCAQPQDLSRVDYPGHFDQLLVLPVLGIKASSGPARYLLGSVCDCALASEIDVNDIVAT